MSEGQAAPPPPPLLPIGSDKCGNHQPVAVDPDCPAPLPRPPPLSMSGVRSFGHPPSDKKGIVQEYASSSSTEQVKKAYQWFIQDQGLTEDQVNDFVTLARYRPVKPVIQNGPLCGMVALAMVTQLVGEKAVTTEAIFELARKENYSLQGEMFSVASMQRLATSVLGTDCQVRAVSWASQSEAHHLIVSSVMQGQMLLLPYDADRNHGPCQAKGHKAHWALVTGFFAALKKDAVSEQHLLSSLSPNLEIPGLYTVSDSTLVGDDLVTAVSSNACVFQLMMHQGKSKHCGVWNLPDLIDSNDNLVEAGSERDGGDFLLPPGGVEEGLCHQAVLIICPRQNTWQQEN